MNTKILFPITFCFFIIACQLNREPQEEPVRVKDQMGSHQDLVSHPIEKDSSVLNYILAQKVYVPLVDEWRMPELVRGPYAGIIAFMHSKKMEKNDYYQDTTGIQMNDLTISIPLYHYDGFVKAMEMDIRNEQARLEAERNYESPVYYSINGNLSGKDGFLEIDKRSQRVISFIMWQ